MSVSLTASMPARAPRTATRTTVWPCSSRAATSLSWLGLGFGFGLGFGLGLGLGFGLALALLRGREVKAVLLHPRAVAEEHGHPLHLALQPAPQRDDEARRLAQPHAERLRVGADGAADGVLAAELGGGGEREELGRAEELARCHAQLRRAAPALDARDGELARGEGAWIGLGLGLG